MRTLFALMFIILVANPVSGQINIPNTFVPQTRILSSDVNENFTELGTKSLNRTGGTMTGTLTTQLLVPDGNNTRALGASGTRWSTVFGVAGDFSGALAVTGVATFGATPGVNNAAPGLFYRESGVAANNGGWLLFADGTQFLLATVTDLDAFGEAAWITSRSGTLVTGTGFTGTVSATTGFSGPGASLTSLNASNISSGSLADARLSSNVALLADNETVTGNWTFTGAVLTIDNNSTDAILDIDSVGAGGSLWRFRAVDNGGGTPTLDIRHATNNDPTIQLASAADTLHVARAPASGQVGILLTNGSVQTGRLFLTDPGAVLTLSTAGVSRLEMSASNPFTAGTSATVVGGALGTGAVTGASIDVQHNNSGGTAAGWIGFRARTGGIAAVWSDAAGLLRVDPLTGAGPPQEDGTPSDTSGTIIGTQSSTRASKNIFGEFTDNAGALETILQTPLWSFNYRSGAYNGQSFVGVTTEDSPTFGMDQGRSFNPVTAFGMTVGAIKELERRIKVLESNR